MKQITLTTNEKISTATCGACFTHFMTTETIVFRKTNFHARRTKLVAGHQCPSCGHLIAKVLGIKPKSDLHL